MSKDIIDNYVSEVFVRAKKNGIVFDVIGGFDDGKVDLCSSDIDIICKKKCDARALESIAIDALIDHKEIRYFLRRADRSSNVQLLFCGAGEMFFFDIIVEFRIGHLACLEGDVYFQLQEEGVDGKTLLRFIKRRAALKKIWPNLPKEVYSFRVIHINILDKIISYFIKICINIRCIFEKNGVYVALLGPDGSGKSTVLNGIVDRNIKKRTIIPVYSFHWCPQFSGLLKECIGENVPVTDPHAKANRSICASVIKLMYLMFKFNICFLLSPIRRLLSRDALVIADRYYHDMLADPKRYRMGAPLWLVRLFGRVIPQPDLFLILDVQPEVARARKTEVSEAESQRQYLAYRALAKELPNAVLIDANGTPEEVVAACERAVIEAMARRLDRRMGWSRTAKVTS